MLGELILLSFLTFLITLIITPLVKKSAVYIGAVDKPDYRKVHQVVMPRLGGLAIFISFLIGILLVRPYDADLMPILLGSLIIIIVGVLDDIYQLTAKVKLFGQIIAATIIIGSGLYMQMVNLPLLGEIHLGVFGIPITFLWIIGITNAVNLIDGLDGLAAGVSSIILFGISVIAYMDGHLFIFAIALLLLSSTLGFLPYNFYPAKIFMGDTGALFLGFMLSVISLLGFKGLTLFSILVPIVIMAVPISDTLFAIIRRIIQKKKLSAPDKSHLHHCFLNKGFSHRKTVIVIYLLSTFFMISAILLTQATLIGSFFILIIVSLVIELLVEKIGLVDSKYRPVLNVLAKALYKEKRFE